MRRAIALAALTAVAVAACGSSSARNGQEVGGTIRALEHAHHGKPSSKRCNSEGAGESCVLTWPDGATSEVTSSGPAGRHPRIVVIKD